MPPRLALILPLWVATYLAAFAFRVVPLWPAVAVQSLVTTVAAWTPETIVRLGPSSAGRVPARRRARAASRLVLVGLAVGAGLWLAFCAGALLVRGSVLWPAVLDVVGLTRSGAPRWVGLLVIVAVAAPAEELLWRGLVFDRLAAARGGRVAVVGSTLGYALFVGVAGNPVLPLAALGCGGVWAFLRLRTGSLLPGLVAHQLWSSLMLLAVPGT